MRFLWRRFGRTADSAEGVKILTMRLAGAAETETSKTPRQKLSHLLGNFFGPPSPIRAAKCTVSGRVPRSIPLSSHSSCSGRGWGTRASSLINRGECGGEKSVGKNGPDCVRAARSEWRTLSLQEGLECYRAVWMAAAEARFQMCRGQIGGGASNGRIG